MVPKTQKALLVTEVGKLVSLFHGHPVPQPGPKQVQVKVTVAGLNPHDQKSRDTGLFIADTLPAILTNDVVGTVTALGTGATKYSIGDRLVTQSGFSGVSDQNGLQEYTVVDEDFSCKLPDGTSDDEGATLPTNIIAPLVALFDPTGLDIPAPWTSRAKTFDYAGTTLLIIGGGSNCGRFGVQLAKLAGFGKIVAVGGNEGELKKFGATEVLDRHGGFDLVLQRILEVVGDDLLYVYDAVSSLEDQVLGVNALSSHRKGKFARLVPRGTIDDSKVIGKKAGYEVKNVFGSSHARPELCKSFWQRVPGYLETGEIKPLSFSVEEGLDADKVNQVLDRYRDGKAGPKVHIHI